MKDKGYTKILFVHAELATFTKMDLDILQSAYEVKELNVQRTTLLQLLRYFIQTLQGVLWANQIFVWFGGYHALLPFLLGKLLRRRCIVVASGYDVANLPEIDYGNMRPGLRRIIGRCVFYLADDILPVSKFTAGETIQNTKVAPTKIHIIEHGLPIAPTVDSEVVTPKISMALTVAYINQLNLTRKGLKAFVSIAGQMPEIPFILIGPANGHTLDVLRAMATPNVIFTGPLYGSELFHYMAQAKVYVQLSYYESFGMSLLEAMLNRCIPVVANRAALPEVVGELGFCVPYGDEVATVAAIRKALTLDDTYGECCRMRVYNEFNLAKRQERLLNLIDANQSNHTHLTHMMR